MDIISISSIWFSETFIRDCGPWFGKHSPEPWLQFARLQVDLHLLPFMTVAEK